MIFIPESNDFFLIREQRFLLLSPIKFNDGSNLDFEWGGTLAFASFPLRNTTHKHAHTLTLYKRTYAYYTPMSIS
jgi:hypothetical protein